MKEESEQRKGGQNRLKIRRNTMKITYIIGIVLLKSAFLKLYKIMFCDKV